MPESEIPPITDAPVGAVADAPVSTVADAPVGTVADSPVGAQPEAILEVRDLVKTYPIRQGVIIRHVVDEVLAVQHINLQLKRGKTLGVVGESGSGKSTLARILIGLEKPTSGQILLEGVDISTMDRAARKQLRSDVQIVFQDPYTSLNPRMTVGQIIGEAFTLHPHSIGPQGKQKSILELLDFVGLERRFIDRYPHQFSGGQRQRIGIARAIAVKPKILVLDEPVSALDVSIQGQVINLLRKMQRELGLTYLFIAHDLAVVRTVAHDIAVMNQGKVVEYASREDLYDNPQDPYTQSLLNAVPNPDPSAERRRPIMVR